MGLSNFLIKTRNFASSKKISFILIVIALFGCINKKYDHSVTGKQNQLNPHCSSNTVII
jgi:hypothetical protein